MKRVVFLSAKYFDFEKSCLTIGGVQTYLSELIEICKSLSIAVELFQIGDSNQTKAYNHIDIYQIKVAKTDYQSFCNAVAKRIRSKESIVVFASETIVPKTIPFDYSMAIQHGINWDVPISGKLPLFLKLLSDLKRDYTIISQVKNLNQVVCVDYNYVNWLRAQTNNHDIKLTIIPNYTRIAPVYNKPSNRINIIFARRLFEYRGTRVFTWAAKRILNEYPNVHVTVAGTGPDEDYMKHELQSFTNVDFITYKSSESLAIHADKHIAVVPTIGSEGTSLSLLEAMSAQCAVVASNVGGITNIVLGDYNGLLVNAGDDEDLYRAMRFLIDNPIELKRLSDNGYATAKQAFSYERWAEKWAILLKAAVE